MKKNIVIIVAMLAILTLTGCGGTHSENTETENRNTIKMAGSTSMEKLANAMAESFMKDNPHISVTVEFIGSSAGIEAVDAKTTDIGNSSRKLTDAERSKGITENIVAMDGIAVIVHKDTAENITKEQLQNIYLGNMNNWKEIGGKDQPIVVVGREAGSGTREAFENYLEITSKCRYANELDSTGAVMARVAQTPGAIGYISLDVLNNLVTALKLDGIAPTEESIQTGLYPLSRPFIMSTKGEIKTQTPLIQSWFHYMESEKGKEIIKKMGFVPAK